jgi:hypothetical protein
MVRTCSNLASHSVFVLTEHSGFVFNALYDSIVLSLGPPDVFLLHIVPYAYVATEHYGTQRRDDGRVSLYVSLRRAETNISDTVVGLLSPSLMCLCQGLTTRRGKLWKALCAKAKPSSSVSFLILPSVNV